MSDKEGVPEAGEENQTDISFESFVFSLATQALIQLGEMPPPPGVELNPDVTAAKQTIDILTMLKLKTKGNLTSEEERMLTEMLHNLRMSFLRHS